MGLGRLPALLSLIVRLRARDTMGGGDGRSLVRALVQLLKNGQQILVPRGASARRPLRRAHRSQLGPASALSLHQAQLELLATRRESPLREPHRPKVQDHKLESHIRLGHAGRSFAATTAQAYVQVFVRELQGAGGLLAQQEDEPRGHREAHRRGGRLLQAGAARVYRDGAHQLFAAVSGGHFGKVNISAIHWTDNILFT